MSKHFNSAMSYGMLRLFVIEPQCRTQPWYKARETVYIMMQMVTRYLGLSLVRFEVGAVSVQAWLVVLRNITAAAKRV